MAKLIIRQLGLQTYQPIWQAMKAFTDARNSNDIDEFWVLEHPPVFTQGLAGKKEHLLNPGDIPVIQIDRGGQVTYHGPGQLVIYFMIDIKRLKLGIRQLVTAMEQSMINVLKNYHIEAQSRADAPGVYVSDKKIGALGLRVRRGCSYHGLSLNVALDLAPFKRINPCGYTNLDVTQISALNGPDDTLTVSKSLIPYLTAALGYDIISETEELPRHL